MPVNIQFEPSPFLQVMGSWWAGRRATAHRVKLQEAQLNLQQQQVGLQAFSAFANTGLQAAGLMQQGKQFDARLAQQAAMQQAGLEQAFAMADYKLTGMRPGELEAARDMEIASGTIAADTTLPQYRRKVAKEQLKLTQDPVFNRQRDMWSLETVGMPYATAVENAGALGVPTHEYMFGLRQQRQSQVFAAEQARTQRASAVKAATEWAKGEQRAGAPIIDEYTRLWKAQQTAAGAAAGHGPIPPKIAQQTVFQAENELIAKYQSSQPDPGVEKARWKAKVHTTTIRGSNGEAIADITMAPRPEGTQIVTTTHEPKINGIPADNYASMLNNSIDAQIRAYTAEANARSRMFLAPGPPPTLAEMYEVAEAEIAKIGQPLEENGASEDDIKARADQLAGQQRLPLGQPAPPAQQQQQQEGRAPAMSDERQNAMNFIAEMKEAGQPISQEQAINLWVSHVRMAMVELGPGASKEDINARADQLLEENGGMPEIAK